MKTLAAAAVLLAAPLAARADIGLRLGAEALLAHHDSSGTTLITDELHPSANVMISYITPGSIIAFDLELSEAFRINPPAGQDMRQGTTLWPGITLSPPVIPIYVRAAVPFHLEPSPFLAGLRVGAGLTGNLLVLKLYLEADADFPLFGGTGAPDAFSQQNISLGAGVSFQF